MKITSWKKDKAFLFGLAIISLPIIFFIAYLSRHLTFVCDDFGYSIGNTVFEAFTRDTHGRGYIGFFLNQFFSFNLPILLNIHPGDFTGIWHGVIKGLFTVLTLLVISNFSTFYNKNRKIYFSFFCVISLYFFVSVITASSYVLEFSYNFYRYVFSILFLCIFGNYIYKHTLIKYKKTNYLKLFGVSISGFIVGTSIEISFYASLLLGTLLVSYNLLLGFIQKIKKSNKINDIMLNIDRNFYIPFLSLVTGILFFTSQSGYKDIARDRGMENINLSVEVLKEFFNEYFQVCFKHEFVYWLIFIPCIITCFYIARKRNKLKKFVFPILYLFSILTTMFSLVLCGKTNVDMSHPLFEPFGYWITHNNIIFLYKILLLIPLLICISYILKKGKNKKIIICSLFFVLMLFAVYKTNPFQELIYKSNGHYYSKQGNYVIEKMVRFNYLNNKEIKMQMLQKNIKDFNYVYDMDLYFKTYIRRVYKDIDTTKITYDLVDNAVENFVKSGGAISKTELENVKFQDLYTTNLQELNKSYNDNVSIEEILDILEN